MSAPPRWVAGLVRLGCPEQLLEAVLGDLEEAFGTLLACEGPRGARRWYRREALRSLPTLLLHKLRGGAQGLSEALLGAGFALGLPLSLLFRCHDLARALVPFRDGTTPATEVLELGLLLAAAGSAALGAGLSRPRLAAALAACACWLALIGSVATFPAWFWFALPGLAGLVAWLSARTWGTPQRPKAGPFTA